MCCNTKQRRTGGSEWASSLPAGLSTPSVPCPGTLPTTANVPTTANAGMGINGRKKYKFVNSCYINVKVLPCTRKNIYIIQNVKCSSVSDIFEIVTKDKLFIAYKLLS